MFSKQIATLLALLVAHTTLCNCRIHHLTLEDDPRDVITLSTFGYLKKGFLQLDLANLSFRSKSSVAESFPNPFAIVLEKTASGGSSIFPEKKREFCDLLKHTADENITSQLFYRRLSREANHVIFHLNQATKSVNIVRLGKDVADLCVMATDRPKSMSSGEMDDLARKCKENLVKNLSLGIDNQTNLAVNFEVSFENQDEEGLYVLSFFNCFQIMSGKVADLSTALKINLNLFLVEKNEDSYLSAGEMPLPTLFLTWAIIYFLAGVSWIFILRAAKGDVFKIHYLMLALVLIKSLSLIFHAINLHYIAVNGIHEAIWAILFYVTYVMKGLLMIISILLVGTGWTFIKHVLNETERRLFVIVIPMQILVITAYIFVEEKEQGDAIYLTWRQLFFMLDLICCGAILFPIVWSIRHLEKASETDGKAAINLRKLKVFKHFYIMVICYIYFTRIIGYLLQLIVPFRYEWLDHLCIELVTFLFFAMTAYKFQPEVNNPYLQLSQDEFAIDNEANLEAEMNEVAFNASVGDTVNLLSRKQKVDEENV